MGRTPPARLDLGEAVERSADPTRARLVLDRLVEGRPDLAGRLAGEPGLGSALVAVAAASRSLGTLLTSDERAVDVLGELDRPVALAGDDAHSLAATKRLELLRIAARDLLGIDPLEQTVRAISTLADGVLAAAVDLAGAQDLAVIAMGKLGGVELNYASDVDVLIVGPAASHPELQAARRLLAVAGRCWPIDTALRPEGRDGSLVRTVQGYAAHWERWAEPWEFQALLKARPVAGDAALGAAFADAVAERLWNRPFTTEDLRAVRAMKERTEALVDQDRARDPQAQEIKRGAGGIRDIEFALQLLQLVHGQHDPTLRVTGSLPALGALTTGGYLNRSDADWLRWSYRFLRRVEHLLQIDDDRPVTTVPTDPAARHRLARALGFRDGHERDAGAEFDAELRACRVGVRQIQERVYFRPLLEAFAGTGGPIDPDATAARLAAFGFADADRTRQAIAELTRGLTRSSTLMQQLLPLLLDWLSSSPDPDTGLLGLRRLASGPTRSMELAGAFRESSQTAWRLCRVLGTSAKLTGLLERNPDMIDLLGASDHFTPRSTEQLVASARTAIDLREGPVAQRRALHRFTDREGLRIGAHDVLGLAQPTDVGVALARLAESAVVAATDLAASTVPLAVIALGRLGGSELSYASDLDLIVVHGDERGSDHGQAEAERATRSIVQFLDGDTPSARVYEVDLDLRPEGRSGPIVRSIDSYRAYFARWAQTWERQALVRARAIAGDAALGAELLAVLEPFVWDGLTDDDRLDLRRMKARIETERLPVGEDPDFHLKLGPGAMADVELCVQYLQLEHGVRGTGTVHATEALAEARVLDTEDAAVLIDAYRFCETTRNRWFLVKGAKSDALPQGSGLTTLARSLDTTAPELRDQYRRVTRRSRRVVARLFYGATD